MRVVLLLVLLVAACAARPPAAKTDVHADFASRRPVMVSIRIEAPAILVEPLRESLSKRVLAMNYSPLAPGAPSGTETGILRVEVRDTEERRDAAARLEDAAGVVLYEAKAKNFTGTPETLAAVLLADLPSK